MPPQMIGRLKYRHQSLKRYIYKLEQLHLLVGNPAEAAATLLLHANLLDWTTRKIIYKIKALRSYNIYICSL